MKKYWRICNYRFLSITHLPRSALSFNPVMAPCANWSNSSRFTWISSIHVKQTANPHFKAQIMKKIDHAHKEKVVNDWMLSPARYSNSFLEIETIEFWADFSSAPQKYKIRITINTFWQKKKKRRQSHKISLSLSCVPLTYKVTWFFPY